MLCTCPDKSTFRARMTALTCTEKSGEAWSLLSGGGGAALEAQPRWGHAAAMGTPGLAWFWNPLWDTIAVL